LEVATGIYIDGLNLYYGALRNTPYRWLDLEKFSQSLFPKDEIKIIRYFTASVIPRDSNKHSQSRQSIYLRAIRTNPKIEVHLGHFKSTAKWKAFSKSKSQPAKLIRPELRPTETFDQMWSNAMAFLKGDMPLANVSIEQEKGTDVNLAAHLVNDASHKLCTKFLIVSNDSDLAGAINVARLSVPSIGILNPRGDSTSPYLKKSAAFEIRLRSDILEKCQMDQTLFDQKGRAISRPKKWT
jgi:uncharacterized LabA/DUF88 family protein